MRAYRLLVLFLFFLTNGIAHAICSLHVRVELPFGRNAIVPVLVEEKNGRKIMQNTRGGVLEFCDLGFERVTVTVGSEGCVQVIVKMVQVGLKETTILPVLYDNSSCDGETLPIPACAVLLRFVDKSHTYLPGVTVEQDSPFRVRHSGDEYGRTLIHIPLKEEFSGTASARGFKTTSIHIPCISSNSHVEKIIALEK